MEILIAIISPDKVQGLAEFFVSPGQRSVNNELTVATNDHKSQSNEQTFRLENVPMTAGKFRSFQDPSQAGPVSLHLKSAIQLLT
jgi:hypothetical protein